MKPSPFSPLTLLAGYLLAGASAAHAQVHFSLGPQVVGTVSTVHASSYPLGDEDNFLFRAGFAAGALASLNIGHFTVQPALLYAQQGYRYRSEANVQPTRNAPTIRVTTLNNTRYSYLTLPLNLAYTPRANGQGLQVFAGPYLSVLLGGNVHYTSSSSLYTNSEDAPVFVSDEVDIATSSDPGPHARRFDAGLQGGLGYRYRALLAQASYSLGLRSATSSYTFAGRAVEYPAAYNRAFQLSIAYLFNSK